MSNTPQKSAFVTGGSKGIGFEVAKALASEGYSVTITSRHKQEVQEAAQQISGQVHGVVCDVRDSQALEQAVESHVQAFGSLDVLVVNAGIGTFAKVTEMTVDQWREVIDINLNGAFYTVKAALSALIKSGGYIFTLSSLAGRNPFARGAAYNASKFGLNGLSEVLNLDLREYDVKVTQIMPGSTATYFNGRAPSDQDAWKIQPEDIAKLVLDLLAMPARTLPSRIEVRPSRPDLKPK